MIARITTRKVNMLDYRRKASHFNREGFGGKESVMKDQDLATDHALHQSYFHAFTASILLPMVELQPYA
jgi:hypothetical protein